MKKIIATAILFTLLLTQATAQIKIGARAGGNASNVKKIGDENNSAKAGIYAGAVAQFTINKHFLIQPELLYSGKGYKFPSTILSINSGGTLNLNYIVIPVLAGFMPTKDVTILLGPEFGFLTNANSRFDHNYLDVTRNFRQSDIAIDLGTAITIKKGLGIELRYCYGLNQLADVLLTDNLGNVYARQRTGASRVFQLGFYYLFAVK